ncbi:MAG: single-stranded-DNA-specific exonuclease RecJ [Calditrichaeota bacterium]|nr:MAG: single-stranded-DNA-specific exonuclease RecJ [Calditrichota bacterium]MBL1204231.1 single-stranded-DNA-specific exonuclease RecJ [Calditrichota bacterium]NOG44061.1 single-stranded-DNA-specific exonuclease RecJ [Calditrichota bacterium]
MLFEWISQPVKDVVLDTSNFDKQPPPVITQILCQREIDSENKFKKFIKPQLSDLYDPFLMNGMQRAVDRVVAALESGEKILIYGDYDVDGVTSVSILYQAIHSLGGKVDFYIPDRLSEGYGLSIAGIEKAVKKKTSLIITVDCGITANNEIAYAQLKGIDTIICDHHELVAEKPDAFAILDPKLKECKYPFKELAGCGVAFKLLQGLCEVLQIEKDFLYQFLDLVALGTAADIVDLRFENRTMVKYGLELINSKPSYGIEALLKTCGLVKQKITVNLIVFLLAPRLNAVGRISNAKKAVHLLTSSSPQQAKNIAQILDSENKRRKDIDEETLKEAEEQIARDHNLEKDCVLVLAKENWHLGVLGIIASRILEKYNRPAVLISINDGIGKGSARSKANFSIFDACNNLSEYLISYGGHECAAGLTIEAGKIDIFRKKINEIATNTVDVNNSLPTLNIDSFVSLNEFTGSFLKWLDWLAPFGPKNMRPVFVTKNIDISGNIIIIGGNHLKFKVKQNGVVIDAIAFNMAKYQSVLEQENIKINCAYVIEESNWHGQVTIQLRIKDFEVSDGTE